LRLAAEAHRESRHEANSAAYQQHCWSSPSADGLVEDSDAGTDTPSILKGTGTPMPSMVHGTSQHQW